MAKIFIKIIRAYNDTQLRVFAIFEKISVGTKNGHKWQRSKNYRVIPSYGCACATVLMMFKRRAFMATLTIWENAYKIFKSLQPARKIPCKCVTN